MMNADQYQALFRDLEIHVRGVHTAYVMRFRERSMQLYFNEKEGVGVYFSARLADENLYPAQLWRRINPDLVQIKDRPIRARFPIAPRIGMEMEAFEELARYWQGHQI